MGRPGRRVEAALGVHRTRHARAAADARAESPTCADRPLRAGAARAHGLEPHPEAPKDVLIRRVSLALTGLPPTPDEVDAFVRDTSPDAYERVVDRLLASPAYGERMAADWLDIARFADTHGYQDDVPRDMSPWRDWVIARVQPQHAGGSVHHLAAGGRPAAQRDARAAARHRLQPASHAEPGRRHRPGGVPGRVRRRPGADARARIPRRDARVCAVPRPQVRPHPAAGVLPAVRVLQQHQRGRTGAVLGHGQSHGHPAVGRGRRAPRRAAHRTHGARTGDRRRTRRRTMPGSTPGCTAAPAPRRRDRPPTASSCTCRSTTVVPARSWSRTRRARARWCRC